MRRVYDSDQKISQKVLDNLWTLFCSLFASKCLRLQDETSEDIVNQLLLHNELLRDAEEF